MRGAILLLIAFLPAAAAHGTPTILDVEDHLIADEASELSYAWDGYDITGVYVRDAYWRPIDGDALIFRIIASGGVQAGSEATLTLSFETNETHSYTFTTTDDTAWTGDLEIVELSVEVDENLPASNVNMQVLLPLADIQAQEGDTMRQVSVTSHVDGTLVDEAPGGLYAPGGVDVATEPGTRRMEEREISAPDQYTDSNISLEEGAAIEVENLITVTGQHVQVLLGDAPGWDVTLDKASKEVEAGQTIRFALDIAQRGSGSLPITITTDIGGQETGYLVAREGTLAWSDVPVEAPTQDKGDQATPAPGLLVAIGAIALALRRR